MTGKTISISQEEYRLLKKKQAIADDLLLQMEASLRDLKAGRIKRVH